jgi:hypothetical protein
VDNVEGAQKELLKYWSRVSGNRWLIAKMFGVLVRQPLSLLPWTVLTWRLDDIFPALGVGRRVGGQRAVSLSCTALFSLLLAAASS